MKRKSLELNISKKKLFKLDFDHSLQLIYSQSNIKVIINLKLERSRLENVNQKKINFRMFCEKTLYLIQYF